MPSDPPGSQHIKALLCLKDPCIACWDLKNTRGRGRGLLSNFSLSSHQPIHKSPKKVQFAQSVAPPVPLRPIPGSHRDPPPVPTRSQPPPPRNAPSQDWAKTCGPVPTHPPFPHIRDAGNAHFWVNIANTPLPKYPSCPVRHTRSPQPPLPPGVRPPSPQWPSLLRTLHPRLPSRPPAQDSSGK